MNFEPELRYHFYSIFVLIKFIAVVLKVGIFRVLNLLRISSQNPLYYQLHIQNFWHKFPSNYKPSQFSNVNFPPIISPSEYKPLPKIRPSKRSVEKYKPRGLFWNFTVSHVPNSRVKNIDVIQPGVTNGIEFLVSLYKSCSGYSAMSTARSALSSIFVLEDGVKFGEHPLVAHCMKEFLS